MNAKDCLTIATNLVTGERARQHGAMYLNHCNIARLWSGYLEVDITPDDVALMMGLLKIARAKTGDFNGDDYVDLAGYAAVAAECASMRIAEDKAIAEAEGRPAETMTASEVTAGIKPGTAPEDATSLLPEAKPAWFLGNQWQWESWKKKIDAEVEKDPPPVASVHTIGDRMDPWGTALREAADRRTAAGRT